MKLSAFGGGIKAGGPNYCTCFLEITDKPDSRTDYRQSYAKPIRKSSQNRETSTGYMENKTSSAICL